MSQVVNRKPGWGLAKARRHSYHCGGHTTNDLAVVVPFCTAQYTAASPNLRDL
jgi:hypothetical protein